jgi:hypothetical protein
MKLIGSPDRLGVDQARWTMEIIPRVPVPSLVLLMELCAMAATRSAGTTMTATCGGAVVLPVASELPLGRLGLGVGKLLWRRRTSCPEPMAPTPSYSAARQGPTSLLTDWASPIRTRVKGPMGRWAHWWRDQSNILPLDLTIYLLTSFLIPLQISV